MKNSQVLPADMGREVMRMETYPEDVVYNGTSERKTYEELHEIVDEIYNLCVERRLNYADFRMVLVYLQHKRVRLDSINSDIADRKVLFTLK
jgi:hypothetical protein